MAKIYDLLTEAVAAQKVGYNRLAADGGRIAVPTADGDTALVAVTVIVEIAGRLTAARHGDLDVWVEETDTTGMIIATPGPRFDVGGTIDDLCWVPSCEYESETGITVCRDHLDTEVHSLETGNGDPARLRSQRVERWRERVETDLRRVQTTARDLDAFAPRAKAQG